VGGSDPRQDSIRDGELRSRGPVVARRKSYRIPSLALPDGTVVLIGRHRSLGGSIAVVHDVNKGSSPCENAGHAFCACHFQPRKCDFMRICALKSCASNRTHPDTRQDCGLHSGYPRTAERGHSRSVTLETRTAALRGSTSQRRGSMGLWNILVPYPGETGTYLGVVLQILHKSCNESL
jgi:hypothetical protein